MVDKVRTRLTSPDAFAAGETCVPAENSLLLDLDSKFDLLRLIQVLIHVESATAL